VNIPGHLFVFSDEGGKYTSGSLTMRAVETKYGDVEGFSESVYLAVVEGVFV